MVGGRLTLEQAEAGYAAWLFETDVEYGLDNPLPYGAEGVPAWAFTKQHVRYDRNEKIRLTNNALAYLKARG